MRKKKGKQLPGTWRSAFLYYVPPFLEWLPWEWVARYNWKHHLSIFLTYKHTLLQTTTTLQARRSGYFSFLLCLTAHTKGNLEVGLQTVIRRTDYVGALHLPPLVTNNITCYTSTYPSDQVTIKWFTWDLPNKLKKIENEKKNVTTYNFFVKKTLQACFKYLILFSYTFLTNFLGLLFCKTFFKAQNEVRMVV